MLDLDKLTGNFSDIFFYASFHHLQKISDRKIVLQKTFDLLQE
jgi:hypothetical protein